MSSRSSEPFPSDEDTDLIPRVVRARRRLIAGSVVGAALAFAAALVVPVVTPAAPAVAPATLAALRLESRGIASAIDAAARAAHVRAERIATAPMVRAAVMTDKATVADMANSDFQYTPIKQERLIKGETLELFQLEAGKITSLMRIPPDAPAIRPLHGRETRLDRAGDGVDVVVSCPVERYKDGPGYKQGVSGSIALSIPIDLTFVRQQLAGDAVEGTLGGVGAPVTLAHQAGLAGAPVTLPVEPSPEWHLSPLILTVRPKAKQARPGWVGPVRLGCAGVGLALLVVAGLAAVRRR